MIELYETKHALARMAQRGIRPDDIPWIMAIGTDVPQGLLVTDKDVAEIERQVKAFVRSLRRIKGKRLIEKEGALLTAYHASERQSRDLLRPLSKQRRSPR